LEIGVSYCSAHFSGSNMISKILLGVQDRIKHWTKPAIFTLTSGLLSDISRSRLDLMVENAMLCQQLIVLNRQIKRPQLTNPDCLRLVFLSHFTKFWNQCLHIVQPDTLLRWHRELFRIYWRHKSQGKPRVSPETISLIQKMARENSLWGG
jgi:putative transposase